jgi:hypothetical protein
MLKRKHFIFPATQLYVMHKLVKECRSEVKIKYVNRLQFATAVHCWQLRTFAATLFFAIAVTGGAKSKFQEIILGPPGAVMIHQHAGIFRHPWMLRIMPPDHVIDRPRDVLFLLVQNFQAGLYAILVCNF